MSQDADGTKPSTLLALPAELRLKMLRHILIKENSFLVDIRPRMIHGKLERPYAHQAAIINTSIMRACRTLHDEAVGVFYKESIFRLDNAEPVRTRSIDSSTRAVEVKVPAVHPDYAHFIRHVGFTKHWDAPYHVIEVCNTLKKWPNMRSIHVVVAKTFNDFLPQRRRTIHDKDGNEQRLAVELRTIFASQGVQLPPHLEVSFYRGYHVNVVPLLWLSRMAKRVLDRARKLKKRSRH